MKPDHETCSIADEENMMYCGNCGAENAAGSVFCGSCGADLRGEAIPMKAPGQANRMSGQRPEQPDQRYHQPGPYSGQNGQKPMSPASNRSPQGGKKLSDRTKLILLIAGIGLLSVLVGFLASGLRKNDKDGKKESASVSSEVMESSSVAEKKDASESEAADASQEEEALSESASKENAGTVDTQSASSHSEEAEDEKHRGESEEDADSKSEEKQEETAAEVNPADLLDAAINTYASKILSCNSTTRFALVYINGDVIPELVLSDGSYHVSWSEAYTYTKDGMKKLEGAGSDFGAFYYAPEQNLIRSFASKNGGYEIETLYKIKQGQTEQVKSFYAYSNGNEYKVDDSKVSKDEYTSQYNAAKKGYTIKSLTYEKMFVNTKANVQQMQEWYNNFIMN